MLPIFVGRCEQPVIRIREMAYLLKCVASQKCDEMV